MKRICIVSEQIHTSGKKLNIPENKASEIIQKNRELRIQIKSLLKEQPTNGKKNLLSSSVSGSLHEISQKQQSSKMKNSKMNENNEKTNNTKRELIKQRNQLMEEND